LAIPHFVIDTPGGGGKIPLLPNYVLHHDEDRIILRNYRHKPYVYKNYKDKLNPVNPEKEKKLAVTGKTGTNGKNGKNGNGRTASPSGRSKLKVIDFTKIEFPVLQYEDVEN